MGNAKKGCARFILGFALLDIALSVAMTVALKRRTR